MNIDPDSLPAASSLKLAMTCRREVRAGIERIWENVFDWEHLPVLHDDYFDHVELLEIGSWGWRLELTKQPGTPDRCILLELRINRARACYRVRTLAGDGAGTEIWTLMELLGPHRTTIEVRYYLPEQSRERLEAIGERCRRSCERLWDQDEAMMMRREALSALAAAKPRRAETPLPLGPLSELRQQLPLLVEFDGKPFRIVEIEGGALVAHATICPHWLGPLEEAAPRDGILRCPWHGYLFDVRTGHSADGRGYQLAPAPRIVIDPVTGGVTLTRNQAADGR